MASRRWSSWPTAPAESAGPPGVAKGVEGPRRPRRPSVGNRREGGVVMEPRPMTSTTAAGRSARPDSIAVLWLLVLGPSRWASSAFAPAAVAPGAGQRPPRPRRRLLRWARRQERRTEARRRSRPRRPRRRCLYSEDAHYEDRAIGVVAIGRNAIADHWNKVFLAGPLEDTPFSQLVGSDWAVVEETATAPRPGLRRGCPAGARLALRSLDPARLAPLSALDVVYQDTVRDRLYGRSIGGDRGAREDVRPQGAEIP